MDYLIISFIALSPFVAFALIYMTITSRIKNRLGHDDYSFNVYDEVVKNSERPYVEFNEESLITHFEDELSVE